MAARITVYVVDYGRKYLILQWIDPTTGKRRSKSSGCVKRRDAERAAGELEKQLNSTIPKGDGSLPWDAFVDLFHAKHLAGLDDSSQSRSLSVLSVFQQVMNPTHVGAVTTAVLSEYAERLRQPSVSELRQGNRQQRAESTIATHFGVLRTALRWADAEGHLSGVPKFPRVSRALLNRSKGRPLATEEFVRMLQATKSVVGAEVARDWRWSLRGLWLSGLRLGEAIELSWDRTFALWVELDAGPYPLLGISAEYEKGRQDRLLPLTPDFASWLLRTPTQQRHGPVFRFTKRRHADVLRLDHVSKVIQQIGRASGVRVANKKFASAHDLRRSFGLRWAHKVMPAQLQQLMRHADISTTMTYYATFNAQTFAADLWRNHAGTDTTLNTTPNRKPSQK